MKTHLLFLLLISCLCNHIPAKNKLDSLLHVLDDKIENNHLYLEIKKSRIEDIKAEKNMPQITVDKIYYLNSVLSKEYKTYISDSAIHYLNQNLNIAFRENDFKKINETSIEMAIISSFLGMYKEGIDALENVRTDFLDIPQKINYYNAYRYIYSGLGQYTQNQRERGRYWRISEVYKDSVLSLADKNSEEYLRLVEVIMRQSGKIDEALEINDKRLSLIKTGTPAYALVMFNRSLLYRRCSDFEMEKECLILSSISDVQCAIKDNASIPILANLLMRKRDVDRAHRYVRFSLDNINEYNTRVRSSEILNIQTIIDKAYQNKNEKKEKELRLFLILISILSVLLIISVCYVYKQMRKGFIISRRLKEANLELNELNQKLYNMNETLKKINSEAAEANYIKEEYIGYFLAQCSKYIEKLDEYRKMVNKSIQNRQIENLYKITKDNTLKEEEIKELFVNFDIMFVHLFPDFIEKFNLLLQDEEQITLKKGEVLNNELRIFALIRLGIDDSTKIASFLGYSVNTIYNYRTKTRNKAKYPREDFEWMVKKIGTFRK